MKKTVGVMSRIFLIILMGMLIGYDIYLFIATYICREDIPMPFGFGHAVIMSGSMEPVIDIYDVVIIRKKDSYQVGDIVTFRSGNVLVTHRIIRENDGLFVTKGDANNAEDPVVSQDKMIGYVSDVIPNIGGVLLFLQKPIGMVFIVLILLVGMEISFRRSLKSKKKRIDLMKEQISELHNEVEMEKERLHITDEDVYVRVKEKFEPNIITVYDGDIKKKKPEQQSGVIKII